MKYILLTLILTASVCAQIKSPGVNGENIVNPAFRNAVLPSQGSANGKYLKSNGTAASWETVVSDLTSGPVTSSNGVSAIADGAIGVAKITGLGPAATITYTPQKVVNVKDFGATGDGVTDDTVAVQAAALSIGDGTGGVLYFPKGTYVFTLAASTGVGAIPWGASAYGGTTSVVSNQEHQRPALQFFSNMTIQGDGIDATILKMADSETGHPFINISGTTNVRFADFTIDGNRGRSQTLHFEGENELLDTKDDVRELTVERVKFIDGDQEAIDLDNDEWDLRHPTIFIRDCIFENIGGEAIHNATWCIVERCVFRNCSWGRYRDATDGESSGAEGQGAIDGNGEMFILRDSFFYNCARAVHIYRDTTATALGQASGTLTFTANPSAGETVTVGAQVYTFVASIAATASASTDRITKTSHGLTDGTLIRFVQAQGGRIFPNINYYVRDADTNTFKVTATPGGAAIDLTSNDSTLYYVTGGALAANTAPIFATRAATVANLAFAINGLDHRTTKNASASATFIAPTLASGTPDVLSLVAIAIGSRGNSVALTETGAAIAASAATLTGGGGRQETFTRITNCVFEDWQPTAKCVDLLDVTDVVIQGCRFLGSGIAIQSTGVGLRINNCDITSTNNLAALNVVNILGADSVMSNTRVRGGRVGIQGSGTAIMGNDIEAAYSSLYLEGAGLVNVKIVGNKLRTTGNTVLGAAGAESPIQCVSTAQSGHTISGNFLSGGNAAISLPKECTVSGNVIGNFNFDGITVNGLSNSITGNRIYSATGGVKCINFLATATGCTAAGNFLSGTFGVVNTGINNTISGNVGSGIPIDTSGTGTPEAVVTGIIGSRYINLTNGDIYRKTSGSAATGWVTP